MSESSTTRPKTLNRPASALTDDELRAEDAWLATQWNDLRASLQESGGMSGSPGEWIAERSDEVYGVMKRKGLVS